MTDVDHFKKFNDTFGHLTGDQVLRLVAMSVKQNVKGQDIAARYGGEEFAVVLPNTALRAAITVGDHIRRAVMAKELMKRSTGEHLGRVTISVGVAVLRPETTPQTPDRARRHACLYTPPSARPQSAWIWREPIPAALSTRPARGGKVVLAAIPEHDAVGVRGAVRRARLRRRR